MKLPDKVITAMGRAMADEQAAFATYTAILDRFGAVRPFSNIVNAEKRHMEMLTGLYTKYGVPVPVNTALAPPDVAKLDLQALCQVGVEAEVENVRLYDEELLPIVADFPEIRIVLQNLRDASAERHLPAFQRCVARGGEIGSGSGRGQGKGRNRGESM